MRNAATLPIALIFVGIIFAGFKSDQNQKGIALGYFSKRKSDNRFWAVPFLSGHPRFQPVPLPPL